MIGARRAGNAGSHAMVLPPAHTVIATMPAIDLGSRRKALPVARVFALAMAAVTLAGCVVGPDYHKPNLAMPAKWGNAKPAENDGAPQLSKWWTRLGDPMLDELVDQAVAGNLDVAAAKARVREARATYRQQVGTLFPAVDASASATRSANGGNVSDSGDITVEGPFNSFQAGFDASWELDLFGANRRGIEAARYGAQAADEELRDTLVTLIGDVTSNYVAARGFQARLDLARRTAASQRETAGLTRTKLEAGAASAVDVANATGQAASTEANVPALESQLAQTVHRLSVLTGQPPTALADRMKKAKPIPTPKLPIPAGIPADILATRPDVRMAERQLAQSTALIGQAEANRYPAVSLVGSVATSGVHIGDLAKQSSISWSFGPTLTLPVFQGGQLQAAVEIAQAQRDQSFVAYRASVLTALEDVENALVALAQERARRAKLATASASYRQASTLSRALYETGAASFLDVLVAERSLYTAEDALIQSRIDITNDYIALNKALGGGWDGVVDASRPEIVDTGTGPHLPRKSDGPNAGKLALIP